MCIYLNLMILIKIIRGFISAQRFRAFIGEIAERAPQEKEKLMTIADRLREEGAMQGKHEEALRIAQEMLDRGLDRELVMMVTRLSPDDLIAQSH